MGLARYFLALPLFLGGHVVAAPPQLYHRAAYESPVRGDPDDLLLLAGYGFAADDAVVYRALAATTDLAAAPSRLPRESTADLGVAPIVSVANIPYSLTIKLPQIMRIGQTYALWVRTRRGEWSRPVKINDARPLWFTPAYVYATASPASLPRELKVVGRNMQPGAGHATRIKLIGSRSLTLDALALQPPETANPAESMNQYVARAPLPRLLTPGRYRIVISRDGTNWLGVNDQWLEVLPDPPPAAEFSVSDAQFGGCRPDDGADDTACILRAISAASQVTGGSVYFGPGTWDLIDSGQPGVTGDDGIVVSAGVRLRGAGAGSTRLARHAQWSERAPAAAALTLQSHTAVTGFTFLDLKVYQPRDRAGPFLQLGEYFDRVPAAPATSVVDSVVITGNVFDKTMVAVGNGGLPIRRLFVTYNTFGAFHAALELAGNGYNMLEKYRVDDSVIAHNMFKPGSELNLPEKTGPLVSELGAGHRVDFSGNTADGASTDFLYSPEDAKGWRAAFFWNMNGSIEEVLVSQNLATCTGDKIGDGEAISFDNNANTYAFEAPVPAVLATASSIAVSASLAARQNNRDVPLDSYYVGHWVQVVEGPGLGQARKIVRYFKGPISKITTFEVAPDWDVVPIPGRSRISVGREFWQLYTVANEVDNRKPTCQKSNRSRHNAGAISMWAQSADSVIAGNRQYDSDGIFVQQNYIASEHPCADCTMAILFQSSLEIRGNLVDGEYDWGNDCSTSGIALGVAAAPWGDAMPPTVGFGVSVSHNMIRHADGQYSGAIAQLGTWHSGPPPHRWALSQNVLIHHNSIADIAGARALALCGKSRDRVGIAFPDDDIAWNTVLYANSCRNVAIPIGPGGVNTARICPSSAADSCECRPADP